MKIRAATAVRLARKVMIGIGVAACATAAAAQTVPDDQQVPSAGLDLPANLQIFGKADPNVRKPTAIVNDSVITGTDVDQRLTLMTAINNVDLSAEDRERLRVQILRQLIDETLQIQEAQANKIEITRDEIDTSFARVSRNFKRSPDEMRAWLKSIGSSERTIKRQIEGELAWNRLLRRRVSVEVSEAEVKAIIKRWEDAKGTPEYHIYEIYSMAAPDRADEIFTGQQQAIEQLRRGVPFEALARAISDASSKATGGDLGWVRTNMLPESLARAVEGMQVGQVAGPIEAPGGFSIVYLADKRQIGAADARDAKLSLKQLTLRFPATTTEAQATARASEFAAATQKMQGCGDAARIAGEIGGEVVDNDAMKIKDLPPALQNMILELQIGQATRPFGSIKDGVRVLVLCGRDDPQQAYAPTPEQVESQVAEQRTNLRAQRMLRDLRRDALVEYR